MLNIYTGECIQYLYLGTEMHKLIKVHTHMHSLKETLVLIQSLKVSNIRSDHYLDGNHLGMPGALSSDVWMV